MSTLESLYPFLYEDTAGPESTMKLVRRSTVEKAEEIVRLRAQLAAAEADRISACAADMATRFTAGGQLLAFGNGGSSTDAQDLASLFMHPPGGVPALPALCLTSDAAVLTALSNDIGFEVVFARQVAAFGRPGDIALGLSTSGNSPNLVRAFERAHGLGMLTVGLAGYAGGAMAESGVVDHLFVVPSSSVHRIQEAQTTAYHVLWEAVIGELPDPDGRR